MKKLVSIVLMALSFTCVGSLAMPPFPPPVPGDSCIATYPAATDPGNINFCGCYAGTSESTCQAIGEQGCADPSTQLTINGCEQAAREGGVTNFCNNEHNEHPTAVVAANCIAGMTIVCGHSSDGTGICNPCWTNGTCYSVGA